MRMIINFINLTFDKKFDIYRYRYNLHIKNCILSFSIYFSLVMFSFIFLSNFASSFSSNPVRSAFFSFSSENLNALIRRTIFVTRWHFVWRYVLRNQIFSLFMSNFGTIFGRPECSYYRAIVQENWSNLWFLIKYTRENGYWV